MTSAGAPAIRSPGRTRQFRRRRFGSVYATPDFFGLAALRAEPPTARLPIVLATAAVRQVDASADQLAALAVQVVVKPFSIDALGAVIAQALAASPDGAAR
jgi:hypothetical protein